MLYKLFLLFLLFTTTNERVKTNLQAVILSGVSWLKSDHERHLVRRQSSPVRQQVTNCCLLRTQLVGKPEVAAHDVNNSRVPTQRKPYNTCSKDQNPLHTFSCNFPVDGEAANLLAVASRNGFGKRQETTDTTDFCPRQLIIRTCCGFVTGKLV